MNLTIAAGDIINGEVERRWPLAGIDEAQTVEARAEYERLREAAVSMAETVPQVARWAMASTIERRLLVAELEQLHPVELEELVIALARAVARHDPDRFDGRFSTSTQKLADTFRS